MSSIEGEAGVEIPLVRPDAPRGPAGIRGWLLLLAFVQVVGTFAFPLALAFRYRDPENLAVLRQYPLAAYGELALSLAMFLLAFVTTVLLVRKSRNFPRFFILLAVASVLVPLLDLAWVALGFSIQLGKPISDFLEVGAEDIRQALLSLIGAAICIAYVFRSKRVRNTFILGLSARDVNAGADEVGAVRLETPLLLVIGAVIVTMGVSSIVHGVNLTIGRGAFNGSIVGGVLQVALALWLLRGSDVARLLLSLLFCLGTAGFVWIAFYPGQSPVGTVVALAVAEVSAVIFWFLAFSKRLRGELAINELKYAKPGGEEDDAD